MFTSPRPYTIRAAAPADREELRRLAAVDSQPVPRGAVLLAEVDGRIVAAVSMATGRAVADPFLPTSALIAALRTTRTNHLRNGRMPSLRDRIVASLRPAALAGSAQ